MTTLRTYEPKARIPEMVTAPASFAYRRVDLTKPEDRTFTNSLVSASRWRSANNWRWYDGIGEVHYGISRSARVAGYGNPVPERINAVGTVTDQREQGVLAEIIAGIYAPWGGVRGLIERYYTLMKVPAEAYLIRVRDDEGLEDGYWFLSPDEIDSDSFTGTGEVDTSKPVKWITANIKGGVDGQTNTFSREIEVGDFIGRVWNPSKRWVDMVDSPMEALSGLCETLTVLSDTMLGRLRQRFALSGVLLIPSEINDANIAGARPGDEHADKVLNYLITVMTRNVTNHQDALAHIPALLKGPADALEAFRHVILDSSIAAEDLAYRGELIGRILDGLDVQKRKVKGGEGANHWDSWSDSEDEIRLAVRPDLESLGNALTRAVLRPALIARGWTPGQIKPWRVGFDLSEAVTRTNQAEDFRQGADRGWISAKAGRRSIGAKESDAPTGDEEIRIVGRILQDPYLATFGLSEAPRIDWDKVKTTKPTGPAAGPGGQGKSGPGVGSPGSPGSRDSDAPKSKTPG